MFKYHCCISIEPFRLEVLLKAGMKTMEQSVLTTISERIKVIRRNRQSIWKKKRLTSWQPQMQESRTLMQIYLLIFTPTLKG